MTPPRGRQTIVFEPLKPYDLTASGLQLLCSFALNKIVRFSDANEATWNSCRDQCVGAGCEARGAHRAGLEGCIDICVHENVIDIYGLLPSGAREHVGKLFDGETACIGKCIGLGVSVPMKFARITRCEDYRRVCDRRVASHEKAAHAKGCRSGHTFRCL